jgi:hypothetical protein
MAGLRYGCRVVKKFDANREPVRGKGLRAEDSDGLAGT